MSGGRFAGGHPVDLVMVEAGMAMGQHVPESYRLMPFDSAFAKKLGKAEDIMGRNRNALRALAD